MKESDANSRCARLDSLPEGGDTPRDLAGDLEGFGDLAGAEDLAAAGDLAARAGFFEAEEAAAGEAALGEAALGAAGLGAAGLGAAAALFWKKKKVAISTTRTAAPTLA